MTKATIAPQMPLFERYTLAALSDLLPYSVRYLDQIRKGQKPLTKAFQWRVSKVLRQTEESLFGPENGSKES